MEKERVVEAVKLPLRFWIDWLTDVIHAHAIYAIYAIYVIYAIYIWLINRFGAKWPNDYFYQVFEFEVKSFGFPY